MSTYRVRHNITVFTMMRLHILNHLFLYNVSLRQSRIRLYVLSIRTCRMQ